MSKLDDIIKSFENESLELGINLENPDLLYSVTKALGPSVYSKEASKLDLNDNEEIERIKNNFLIKKLGLHDSLELDVGIKKVIDLLGDKNKSKFRALFYYLLVQHFRKEELFVDSSKKVEEKSNLDDISTLQKENKDLKFSSIQLSIDPGTAPNEEIASILADVSKMFRKMGGSGINFKFDFVTSNQKDSYEI